MDAEQVYREAVARVQARHSPAGWQPGEWENRHQADRYNVRGFRRATTLSDWLDDRIAGTPPQLGPWVAVLYEIAEAARAGGAEAAAKAVQSARSLKDEWDKWILHGTVDAWRGDTIDEANQVRRAVLDAWGDLGLIMGQPDAWEPQEPDKLPARIKAKQYRRPWGNPAGIAV